MRSRLLPTFAAILVGGLGACQAPPPEETQQETPPAATAAAAEAAPAPMPGGALGVSIRRGEALVSATADSLPDNVGNVLRCVSCHLDGGRRPNGSWVGVYGRYPQYRSRSASVLTIEARVNGCFQRSMNGRPLAPDGSDMRDIVAYLWYLSLGVPVGEPLEPGSRRERFNEFQADTVSGHATFDSVCAVCHGPSGQGTPAAPPLWGPQSFNIGAGMARVRTAAAFVRDNMPFDRPGTLTDQQAYDVAAWVVSHPRPDFPGKELDWPKGDAPPDAAYPTLGASKKGASSPGS